MLLEFEGWRENAAQTRRPDSILEIIINIKILQSQAGHLIEIGRMNNNLGIVEIRLILQLGRF